MSILTEQVTVPASVETRQKAIVCDLCGTQSPKPEDWSELEYHVDQVRVEHLKGDDYPEGSSITKTFFDLCPTCFHTRLMPWLISQGAKPTEAPDR